LRARRLITQVIGNLLLGKALLGEAELRFALIAKNFGPGGSHFQQ
jgi:hypothetical protein